MVLGCFNGFIWKCPQTDSMKGRGGGGVGGWVGVMSSV